MSEAYYGHVGPDLPIHLQPDWDDVILRPYWDALLHGRMIVQSCDACYTVQWPPRGACAACGSIATGWREIPGRGIVYSWTQIAHARDPYSAARSPYSVAVIAHEEHPIRFLGAIRLPEGAVPQIGRKVRMSTVAIGEHAYPVWEEIAG